MPSPQEREMILAVHRASDAFAGGAPRRTFRIAQHERLDVLDDLVRAGVVREQSERYAVEPLTLLDLDDEDAKILLADCETVFETLRKLYVQNFDSMMPVGHFASATGLPEARALRALAYLNTFHGVVGARTGASLDDPSASMAPADQILNTKTFADVLTLLRGHREARKGMFGGLLPTSASTQPPTAAIDHQPPWLHELPSGLAELLREIGTAKASGLRRLTAMGIRTAIDMWADDVAGKDLKYFGAKLDELEKLGCIGKTQREHLDAVVQLGHASAHRGHAANHDDVSDCLDILERVLKAHYVDPKTAQRLKASTPSRPK